MLSSIISCQREHSTWAQQGASLGQDDINKACSLEYSFIDGMDMLSKVKCTTRVWHHSFLEFLGVHSLGLMSVLPFTFVVVVVVFSSA